MPLVLLQGKTSCTAVRVEKITLKRKIWLLGPISPSIWTGLKQRIAHGRSTRIFRRPGHCPRLWNVAHCRLHSQRPWSRQRPSTASGTLGPRKRFALDARGWTRIAKSEPQGNDENLHPSLCAPLVLFDPGPIEGRQSSPLTKVTADPILAEKLRPHQREGVKFMFNCLSGMRQPGHHGCINSDGMGLGKTLQSIAVLWAMLTSGVRGEPSCSRPLILCPSSLVANWGKEIVKWLGERVRPIVLENTNGAEVKETLGRRPYSRPTGGGRPALVMSYSTFRLHKEQVRSPSSSLISDAFRYRWLRCRTESPWQAGGILQLLIDQDSTCELPSYGVARL